MIVVDVSTLKDIYQYRKLILLLVLKTPPTAERIERSVPLLIRNHPSYGTREIENYNCPQSVVPKIRDLDCCPPSMKSFFFSSSYNALFPAVTFESSILIEVGRSFGPSSEMRRRKARGRR